MTAVDPTRVLHVALATVLMKEGNPMATMSGRQLLRGFVRVAVLLIWGMSCGLSSAQDITAGRAYWSVVNRCIGCHVGPVPQNTGGNPINLSDPWMDSLSTVPPGGAAATHTFKGRLEAVGITNMDTLAASASLPDVYAYFLAVRNSTSALISAPVFATTAVSKSTTANFQVDITNFRVEALNYQVSVVPTVANEFTYTAVAGTCAAADSAGEPKNCSVTGTITFNAKGTSTRTAKLVVTPTYASAPTSPAPLEFNISGVGADALVVPGPGVDLFFTTSGASPTATRPVAVTDNAGDPVSVCLLPGAAPFDGMATTPPAFSISAPGSSAGSPNCLSFAAQGGVTPAASRAIDITVLFDPKAVAGPLNAVLEIQRQGDLASTIPLKGNAGPVIQVESSRLFTADSIDVDGAASVDRTFKIFNRGSALLTFPAAPPSPFTISDGQLSGAACQGTSAAPLANSGEYTVVGGTCAAGSSLAVFTGTASPTTECTLTLRFNPATPGLRCGVLGIASNAGAQAVVLEGTGFLGPRLVVVDGATVQASGVVLDFTTQLLSVAYPAKRLTLRNGGTKGNLEIVPPAANFATGFQSTASAGCTSLAPFDAATGGPVCTLDVTFTPTELRSYAAFFDIVARPAGTTGADTTFRVNVAGVGSNVAPALRWEDAAGAPITAFDFGTVQAGSACTSCEVRVYLRNLGTGSARLDLVNAVGTDGTSFTARTDGCSADRFIAEGGGASRCAVLVTFNPTTAGSKVATVQAASSGNGPPSLALSGAFIAGSLAPTLSISQSTAFDDTRVGSSSTPVEFLVNNTGNFPLRVLEFKVSGPFALAGTSCPPRPFALSQGSGCRVSLTFDPSQSGAASGMLEVVSDASPTASRAQLSAQGEAPADLSSGGCSIAGGDGTRDPTLWSLVLLAAIALFYRRRARRARARDV